MEKMITKFINKIRKKNGYDPLQNNEAIYIDTDDSYDETKCCQQACLIKMSCYCPSFACDFFVLLVILICIGVYWGLLIYIFFEFIQFIHLHIELDFGIFASLIANALLPLIALVLLIANFTIIGLFKRKFNATSYPFTAPLLYKLKCSKQLADKETKCVQLMKKCKNFTKILWRWIKHPIYSKYVQEIILIELQHDVQFALQKAHDELQIQAEANYVDSEKIEKIEKTFISKVQINMKVKSANLIKIPSSGMIIAKVHDGIQQAIEESDISLLRQGDNQKAFQEAVIVRISNILESLRATESTSTGAQPAEQQMESLLQ
jgi:hypothetical protein